MAVSTVLSWVFSLYLDGLGTNKQNMAQVNCMISKAVKKGVVDILLLVP